MIWTILAIGLLSAASILIVGIARSNDAETRWKALAQGLRDKGEPILLADTRPADIAADENFFAAPVFFGVDSDSPRSPLLQSAVAPVGDLSVAALLVAATKSGDVELGVITDAMRKSGAVSESADYLLPGDIVRSGMGAIGLDFAPLAAAAARPGALAPTDYSKTWPKLPHLRYVEALGDWLAISAVAELSANNATTAATSLQLIARLADSLAAEPFFASQRQRRQLLGMFAGGVRAGIEADAWSDEQLATFGAMLEGPDLIEGFTSALRGERAQINTFLENLVERRSPSADPVIDKWLGTAPESLPRRQLRDRQIAINRSVQYVLDVLARKPLVPENLLLPESEPVPPEPLPARLRALAEDARLYAQVQTYMGETATACALERHRFATGVYPDQLAALTPGTIQTLPTDILTSQEFNYSKTGDGFVLTSADWGDKPLWTWRRTHQGR